MNILDRIYKVSPTIIQNAFISLFNIKAYLYRYSGDYKKYFKELSSTVNLTNEQRFNDLVSFLSYARQNSNYYANQISIEKIKTFEDIRSIPILTKEDLRSNIEAIHTIGSENAVKAKTGGTTGISLQVLYTKSDNQRRFANVNAFRAKYGYKLGKRTAWFSGKSLISSKTNNVFWRTDYLFKIRYYSTFHINEKTAKYYLKNLAGYKPLFFVGFPSCIYELAQHGIKHKIEAPSNVLAIFPNAETLTDEMREVIEKYFNAKIYDQYGSGEGAPHIFEINGRYIFDPREGFLEVLDDDGFPAKVGNMIVTSYHTKGTPLVRYNIGDVVELEEKFDYNNVPKIKRILGRKMTFIKSLETGKINAGNISNCTKNVEGVISFQVIQNNLEEIDVKVVISSEFTSQDKVQFLNNFRDRVGNKMKINLEYVNEIPRERSGKFHIIKNNLPK